MSINLGEVIVAEGQDWEKVVKVPYPKGKKWRKLSPKLMKFVLNFAESGGMGGKPSKAGKSVSIEAEPDDIIGAINNLFDADEFEEVYLPAVLGLDNQAGRKYLDSECVMMDVVVPFMEASAKIMEASMGRVDTQAALEKSQVEAEGET